MEILERVAEEYYKNHQVGASQDEVTQLLQKLNMYTKAVKKLTNKSVKDVLLSSQYIAQLL